MATVQSNATNSYDIGIWLSETGQSAITSATCYRDILTPVTANPSDADLTDGDGPYLDADGDTCGDLNKNDPASVYVFEATLLCTDSNNDGIVDTGALISWDNNANTTCNGTADAVPGTSSQCALIPQLPIGGLFLPGLAFAKSGTLDVGIDGVANPGDLINYTFTVTNTGNGPLTNVSVTDPAVISITCPGGNPIPSIAAADPDVSVQCTGSYAITQGDIDAGSFPNTATADSNETDPRTSEFTVTIPQSPVIAVDKTSTTTSITAANQQVPYTITVTNPGTVTLTGITVSDPNCDAAPAYQSGDVAPAGSLAPFATSSEAWIYTCTHTVTQGEIDAGGTLDNTVTADSTESGLATDPLQIPIVQTGPPPIEPPPIEPPPIEPPPIEPPPIEPPPIEPPPIEPPPTDKTPVLSQGPRYDANLSDCRPGSGYVDESLEGISTDADGNVYVAGYAYNCSNYDIHVLKYGPDGTLIWHQVYDSGNQDYGYGITLNPTHAVYVVGYRLVGNTYRGVLLKYSLEGVLLWQRDFTTGGLADAFYAVAADADAVYAVGERYNGANFDGLVARFDPNGNAVWWNVWATGDNDTGYAVQLRECLSEERDGQTVRTGCQPVVGGGTGKTERTGWMIDVDSQSGGIQNPTTVTSFAPIYAIALPDDGSLYAGGPGNDGNWRIVRIDADFNPIWNIFYDEGGDDEFRDLTLDSDGYLYGVGTTNQGGSVDVLVVAFDPTGQAVSQLRVAGANEESGHGIVFNVAQRLFVSGQEQFSSGYSQFLLYRIFNGKTQD